MTVIINGQQTHLPNNVVFVKDLADWKSIPSEGTAIALNGKLVKADNWATARLAEFDNLLVISAAYGG